MDFQSFLEFLGNDFEFDTTGIQPDTPFRDIGFDEFDMIELVMSVEDAFSVEVPDEALASIVTVGDFAQFIKDSCEN